MSGPYEFRKVGDTWQRRRGNGRWKTIRITTDFSRLSNRPRGKGDIGSSVPVNQISWE